LNFIYQATGCWQLASGNWLLASGFWLLAARMNGCGTEM
jgi:hypothetical protein